MEEQHRTPAAQITRLLQDWQAGDRMALDQLIPSSS